MPTASHPVARIALALSVEQLIPTTAALAFRVPQAHFPAPWIATVNGVEQPVQTYAAYAPGAAPVSALVFKTVMGSGAVSLMKMLAAYATTIKPTIILLVSKIAPASGAELLP
jgi:hypothetical protein